MANSFKNIVITPNIGNTADPSIVFTGANATVNSTVNMFVYPAANGTLSFEGTWGQLFSITNDLSNNIFSVSDVAGIPLMESYANGQVNLAPVYGNVTIGSSVNGIDVYPTATTFSNATSNTLFMSANGNLGIGNTAPTNRVVVDGTLEVNTGDIYISRTSASVGYIVRPNSVGNKKLAVSVIGGSDLENVQIFSVATTISGNTLNLGTSSVVANSGYSRLPNGIIMMWGNVLANTSAGNVTFPIAYTTIFQTYCTSGLTGFYGYIAGSNSTVIQVRSSQAVAATNRCTWFAIGI